MELQTAKQVLVEALDIAIKKGCFGLNETINIVKALEVIREQPNITFGDVTYEENSK